MLINIIIIVYKYNGMFAFHRSLTENYPDAVGGHTEISTIVEAQK